MSHSQFHCTISFILRHAWLNLWDKHMTTGRINQVAENGKTSEYRSSNREVNNNTRQNQANFNETKRSTSIRFPNEPKSTRVHRVRDQHEFTSNAPQFIRQNVRSQSKSIKAHQGTVRKPKVKTGIQTCTLMCMSNIIHPHLQFVPWST